MKLYAAGAIEDAPDNGIGTRQLLKQAFKDIKDIEIVDPCDFEYNSDDFPTLKDYQKAHNYYETMLYAKHIVNGDIDAVDDCDAIIVCLDEHCGPGTASEATLAVFQEKMVWAVKMPGANLDKVHPWILGCVDKLFHTVDQFKEYLITYINV
jgi:hypothetical protein